MIKSISVPVAIAKNTEVIIPNIHDANAFKKLIGFFCQKIVQLPECNVQFLRNLQFA